MEKKITKYLDFLSEKSIKFDFNKKLSTKEEKFLKFICERCLEKKERNLEIPKKFFEKNYSHKELENIISFIEKFMEKILNYRIEKFQELERVGSFSVFNYYFLEKNIFKFNLSDEFISIFTNNSYFKNNEFDVLIFLRNKYSLAFYNLLKFNISLNKPVDISLNNIKELLDLELSYERFYDFEKLILKPAMYDISNAIGKNISYNKIKNKDSSNSKIIGLSIFINEMLTKENDEFLVEILEILTKLKKSCTDEQIEIIKGKLFYHGKEYVKNNLEYSLDHHFTHDFIDFFIKSLQLNFFENRYAQKIIPYANEHPNLYEIKNIFSNLAQFHSEIFKIMTSLKFYDLSLNPTFLKALSNLKKIKELEYSNSKFIIFAEYNEGKNSYINVYKYK